MPPAPVILHHIPRIRIAAEARELGTVPQFNVIAELKGSEKPDEYVLLGAHLDSWHGATGATDNGTGTIMMLEAMRILKAAYTNPKRTIIVGHWGAEEQGLIGSNAFAEDNPEVIEGMQDDLEPVKGKFQEAFIRVWSRQAENDGFNRLVLGAELQWHEVVVLRAYAKYLRQIGVAFSEQLIQQTLAKHPAITRAILQLFANHFDPAIGDVGMGRKGAALGIRLQIEDSLERVTNPDEDRILRLYVSLIEATLRTNYYQRDAEGERNL